MCIKLLAYDSEMNLVLTNDFSENVVSTDEENWFTQMNTTQKVLNNCKC